jgi:hypothetical protein
LYDFDLLSLKIFSLPDDIISHTQSNARAQCASLTDYHSTYRRYMWMLWNLHGGDDSFDALNAANAVW